MGRRTIQPAAPLAEMPGLDNHLCFALYAASNHMTRIFVPFLEKLGVTYPQYLVLVALWERGSQGVGDLVSTLGMDLGTLSPMLKRIEKKDWWRVGAIRPTSGGSLFPLRPKARRFASGHSRCWANSTAS